jgi:hypothetical protein
MFGVAVPCGIRLTLLSCFALCAQYDNTMSAPASSIPGGAQPLSAQVLLPVLGSCCQRNATLAVEAMARLWQGVICKPGKLWLLVIEPTMAPRRAGLCMHCWLAASWHAAEPLIGPPQPWLGEGQGIMQCWHPYPCFSYVGQLQCYGAGPLQCCCWTLNAAVW